MRAVSLRHSANAPSAVYRSFKESRAFLVPLSIPNERSNVCSSVLAQRCRRENPVVQHTELCDQTFSHAVVSKFYFDAHRRAFAYAVCVYGICLRQHERFTRKLCGIWKLINTTASWTATVYTHTNSTLKNMIYSLFYYNVLVIIHFLAADDVWRWRLIYERCTCVWCLRIVFVSVLRRS